jgi:hypothetical protein
MNGLLGLDSSILNNLAPLRNFSSLKNAKCFGLAAVWFYTHSAQFFLHHGSRYDGSNFSA